MPSDFDGVRKVVLARLAVRNSIVLTVKQKDIAACNRHDRRSTGAKKSIVVQHEGMWYN